MIAVIARMIVKEDKVDAFEAIMKQLQERVLAEESDCEQYDICRARDPNTYIIIERYKDKMALKAHSDTEHFKEGTTKLMEVMASTPQIDVLKIVD